MRWYLWRGRHSVEAAKIFPEETFSHNMWKLLSKCLICQDCSSRVNCILHFLCILNSFCKHTCTHTPIPVHVCSHFLSFPLSPCIICFFQLPSYMLNCKMIHFPCLVQSYFVFSLTSLFNPFGIGYRRILSLGGIFQVFVVLEEKKKLLASYYFQLLTIQ